MQQDARARSEANGHVNMLLGAVALALATSFAAWGWQADILTGFKARMSSEETAAQMELRARARERERAEERERDVVRAVAVNGLLRALEVSETARTHAVTTATRTCGLFLLCLVCSQALHNVSPF